MESKLLGKIPGTQGLNDKPSEFQKDFNLSSELSFYFILMKAWTVPLLLPFLNHMQIQIQMQDYY